MFYNNKRLFYRMCEIKRSVSELSLDICIQIERGNKRYYTSFESADSLKRWYMQLSDEERTCHEVIAGERRKLVIDIDGEEDGSYDFYDFARHIVSRIQCVFLDMEIGVLQTKDVLVYNMCSESKISYHVIVTNMTFSADTCRGLCAIISHGQVWESLVDNAVYKRVQHIRIEGSTKYGQRRWKNIIYNNIIYNNIIYNNIEDERKCCNESIVSENFHKSLLSNVYGVMHSSVEAIVVQQFSVKKISYNFPMTQVLTKHSEILKNFKVRRVSGNRVFLDRIRPSMCIKCDRVHMRENAMICLNANANASSEYTMVCWRKNNLL